MFKRKWLALLIALGLGIGILTGCSPTEQGYYNLMTEINSQKVYTDTGSFELSLAQLPAGMFTGEAALNEEVIRKSIEQNRIEYNSKVDVNQEVFQCDFNIVNKITGASNPLLTLLYRNNILYVKVDGMVSYIGQFCDPAEKQNLDQIFTGVEWISISDAELNNLMMPGSGQTGLMNNLLHRSTEQQEIWKKLLDGMINNVYGNYSGNLVSKSNNQYILTLRGDQLIDTIKPFAVYTINNIDQLGLVLKSFISSLSPAELAEIGLTEDTKEQSLEMIDLMVIAVNQDRSTYISEIESMDAALQAQLLSVVNDSEAVFTLEKINSNTYDISQRLHLNITAGNPNDQINVTLTAQKTIKTGTTIQITAPTTGVITLTELESRLPRRIEINLDNGSYTITNGLISDSGTMAFQVVDNRTYLPLNLVADAMEETIYWDQASNQAYVLKDGQRINMTGIIVNDRTFVKAADFEQLGFKVEWDPSTNTVMIENR